MVHVPGGVSDNPLIGLLFGPLAILLVVLIVSAFFLEVPERAIGVFVMILIFVLLVWVA